ncbi:MAG: AAA family ATPase [Pseudomonadota bacterium]
MTRYSDEQNVPLYATCARFREMCLQADGSLFTPGRAIWTEPNFVLLHRHFNMNPDTSKDTFEAKWRRQLTGAPDAVLQLAAEVMFVHLFIAEPLSGKVKRDLIGIPLGMMRDPVGIPADLGEILSVGFIHPGPAFFMHRPFYLWFLNEFGLAWKRATPESRAACLADPWAFKALLWQVPMKSAFGQREIVLYLVHPDTFEDISSREHKAAIIEAFGTHAQSEDVDRALAEIRAALTPRFGTEFSFYIEPLKRVWQNKEDLPPEPPKLPRRAWLVRGANVEGVNLVPRWLKEGFCSVAWTQAGSIEPGTPRDEITRQIHETWPDESANWVTAAAGNLHRFLTAMAEGDAVVTRDPQGVFVGIITSAARWVEEPGVPSHRQRSVRWLNTTQPASRTDVGPGLASKLRTLLTVTDLTDTLDDVVALMGLQDRVIPPPVCGALPAPTQALADEILFDFGWLAGVTDLLQDRRQLVFYGPPGTGKTFVALRLAEHWSGDEERVRLVQFHPSYAYEDFFEGYRPTSGQGATMGFDLVHGPLRLIAKDALGDPGHNYVLVIDEINRANLAKVFGELYFLLEYRDRGVQLQYSPGSDPFRLPPNLFFVGTMNTADRSIALVDTAMRRRFYFVPFFPDEEPVAGLLARWLAAKGKPVWVADLLQAVNAGIEDRDFHIGPSYFMHPAIEQDRVLERIWRHSVLPRLEEHFYGRWAEKCREFDLGSLVLRVREKVAAP